MRRVGGTLFLGQCRRRKQTPLMLLSSVSLKLKLQKEEEEEDYIVFIHMRAFFLNSFFNYLFEIPCNVHVNANRSNLLHYTPTQQGNLFCLEKKKNYK